MDGTIRYPRDICLRTAVWSITGVPRNNPPLKNPGMNLAGGFHRSGPMWSIPEATLLPGNPTSPAREARQIRKSKSPPSQGIKLLGRISPGAMGNSFKNPGGQFPYYSPQCTSPMHQSMNPLHNGCIICSVYLPPQPKQHFSCWPNQQFCDHRRFPVPRQKACLTISLMQHRHYQGVACAALFLLRGCFAFLPKIDSHQFPRNAKKNP